MTDQYLGDGGISWETAVSSVVAPDIEDPAVHLAKAVFFGSSF